MAASESVKNINKRSRNIVEKIAYNISGHSAVAAIASLGASLAFYQLFKDPVGLELVKNVALGAVGFSVTSLVGALVASDTKNPLELIDKLRNNNPQDILKKSGELYQKKPEKAFQHMKFKLDRMTLLQKNAFAGFVAHGRKMAQFTKELPTPTEAKIATGRDVYRSVNLGVSMPRQKYSSDLSPVEP